MFFLALLPPITKACLQEESPDLDCPVEVARLTCFSSSFCSWVLWQLNSVALLCIKLLLWEYALKCICKFLETRWVVTERSFSHCVKIFICTKKIPVIYIMFLNNYWYFSLLKFWGWLQIFPKDDVCIPAIIFSGILNSNNF